MFDLRFYAGPNHDYVQMRESKPRNYSLNWNLGWIGPNKIAPIGYKNFDEVVTPARTISFIDVNPESTCWPFFGITTNNSFHMYPSVSHRGAGLIAYSDSHVARHKWRDIRTFDKKIPWHAHSTRSPNNEDLIFLQQHAD